MEQVIIGGHFSEPSDSSTRYSVLCGGILWDASELIGRQVVSTTGIIKNLRVKLLGAPGAGTSRTFTLMLDGAPTALTLIIADAATSNSDTTHEVDVVAGKTISLRCITNGTTSYSPPRWTSMFEGGTANESLILGNGYDSPLSKTATEYATLMGGEAKFTGGESNRRVVCPTGGIITDLYVQLSENPGAGSDGYRFTVRLNGATVGESPIVTITTPDTTSNDTAHNLAVVAGDILTLMIEPLNTPATTPKAYWGMTFVATIDGESIMLGVREDPLDVSATKYAQIICRPNSGWGSSQASEQLLGQECTFKKLYVQASAAVNGTYTVTVRIGGGDSNVVAVITATTGNSGALEDTVADFDYVVLKIVATDTPSSRQIFWGMVGYILPPIDYEKALSDSVAIADAIGKAIGMAKSESVGVAESSGLEAEFSRALSDSVAVAEDSGRGISLFKADTINISDAFAYLKYRVLALADTIGITDSFATAVEFYKSPTDTVNVTDSFAKAVVFYKSFTDTVAIAEASVKAFSLVRAETIAVADSIVKASVIVRALADTVAVAESFSYIRGLFKTLTDTIAITDTLTKKAISIVKADTVAITDSTAKAFGKFRTETIAITDWITLIFHPIVLKLKKRIFSFTLKRR